MPGGGVCRVPDGGVWGYLVRGVGGTWWRGVGGTLWRGVGGIRLGARLGSVRVVYTLQKIFTFGSVLYTVSCILPGISSCSSSCSSSSFSASGFLAIETYCLVVRFITVADLNVGVACLVVT